MDFLLLLDCCCAAVAGRGVVVGGGRVELMAATSGGGISNSRLDGKTFTMHWCEAFEEFLKCAQSFTCNDIETLINSSINLAQYPATFVVHEGWGIPITFHSPSHSTSVIPSACSGQTVITAFHVVEDLGDKTLQGLLNFLGSSPVEITVLATLPIRSTLLLLQVPVHLQEMLFLPQVTLILADA